MAETLLGDEMAQKDQAALGTELKQPKQRNRVFEEDLHPPDCAADEQQNLAGWNKRKKNPSKGTGSSMDLYLPQANVELHTQSDTPQQANKDIRHNIVFLKAQLAA